MIARRRQGDILIRDEELALYGHLTTAEFRQAMIDQGEWEIGDEAPSAVKHGWYRWVPAHPGAEYSFWAFPAVAHSRGAFPVSTWDYQP